MKKMMFAFAMLMQPFIWGGDDSVRFYIGEMTCHFSHEEHSRPFGLFFLKRSFSDESNTLLDRCCLVSLEEGAFYLDHVSFLQEDPNEFIVSNQSSDLAGEGEFVGLPWDWSTLHEFLQFEGEADVSMEINNTQLENGVIHSISQLFFEGESHYFATFSAYLYPVDSQVLERFFHESEDCQ